MSLDKSINSGKEKRKPFVGAKLVDHTCRNHGSCPQCFGNRTFKNKKREKACEEQEKSVTLVDENSTNEPQEEN